MQKNFAEIARWKFAGSIDEYDDPIILIEDRYQEKLHE
jgi:hypothetical protein